MYTFRDVTICHCARLSRDVTPCCHGQVKLRPNLNTLAMGIKGLTALLSEHAPASIKEHDIKTLFGRKVAIDASMSIYQFLIAVRQKDGEMLTNDAGETTSHLMGFFYRTIRIVENGIKPAYVFDGKPPEMKKGVVSSG
jgi:flap endonuclease-1